MEHVGLKSRRDLQKPSVHIWGYIAARSDVEASSKRSRSDLEAILHELSTILLTFDPHIWNAAAGTKRTRRFASSAVGLELQILEIYAISGLLFGEE